MAPTYNIPTPRVKHACQMDKTLRNLQPRGGLPNGFGLGRSLHPYRETQFKKSSGFLLAADAGFKAAAPSIKLIDADFTLGAKGLDGLTTCSLGA